MSQRKPNHEAFIHPDVEIIGQRAAIAHKYSFPYARSACVIIAVKTVPDQQAAVQITARKKGADRTPFVWCRPLPMTSEDPSGFMKRLSRFRALRRFFADALRNYSFINGTLSIKSWRHH